jgi:hypothetical protein
MSTDFVKNNISDAQNTSQPPEPTDANDSNNNHFNIIQLYWVGLAIAIIVVFAALYYYYSHRKVNINEQNIQRILNDGRIIPPVRKILQNLRNAYA